MKTYKYHIGIFLLIVLFVLTIPYAWKLVQIVFFPKHVKVLQQLSLFQWAAVGFVSYSMINLVAYGVDGKEFLYALLLYGICANLCSCLPWCGSIGYGNDDDCNIKKYCSFHKLMFLILYSSLLA